MSNNPVIVAAKRTAVGSFNGSLANIPAHDLGAAVMSDITRNIDKSLVSEVIFGQILTAGQGQNPARQAMIKAGIARETPALTINQVCGSGLRAVALASQLIRCGDAEIVIAGGQESMSMAMHSAYIRAGVKMGAANLVDTMIVDGLWDAFNDYHMGNTAENIARKWNISREEQDEFAFNSQMKCKAAQEKNIFADEITPFVIKGKKGDISFDKDEYPKNDTNLDLLARLRPAFNKEGTVTAGNASGINDGAAAILVMSEGMANKHGLQILARIASSAHAGVDPAIMGTGPIPAVKKALDKAGWKISDLDLIESNEAFAAQAISVNKELGWDTSKVNVNGGAIALGHPIGASGARILVTLLHEMQRRKAKKAVATLCVGGGMGVALCVEA